MTQADRVSGRRSWWVVAGGAVALVAVAAIIVGITRSAAHPEPHKAAALHSPRLLRYAVVAHTKVGENPWVITDSSAVFVVQPSGRLVRLDADTLHVAAARTIRGARESVIWLAYGGGLVWGADPSAHRLLAFNPNTLQVAHAIAVDGEPANVAFGDGSAWMTVTQPLPTRGTRHVLERIDPTSGHVTGHTILTGTRGSEEIVVGDVVAVDGLNAHKIELVDPAGMRVVRTVSVGRAWPPGIPTGLIGPPRLATVNGQIYLMTSNGKIVRLSADGPESTVFTNTPSTGIHILPGTSMTSGQGLLWITGPHRCFGIDPALGRITAGAAVPGQTTAPGEAGSGWVLGNSGPATANGPVFAVTSGTNLNYTLERLAP